MKPRHVILVAACLLVPAAVALYRHSPGVRRVLDSVLVQYRADPDGANRLRLVPLNLPHPYDGVIEVGEARNVVELPGGVGLAQLE